MKSLAQIYRTYKIENLYKLLHFIPQRKCMQTLLFANAQNFIKCSVDQNRQIFIFSDAAAQSLELNDASQRVVNFAQSLQYVADRINVPSAQSRTSLKNQLSSYWNSAAVDVEHRLKQAEILKDPRYQDKRRRDEDRVEAEIQRENERQQKEALTKKKLQDAREQQKKAVKQKELVAKINMVKELIKLKGNQVVKLQGKRIELLSDEELNEIDIK